MYKLLLKWAFRQYLRQQMQQGPWLIGNVRDVFKEVRGVYQEKFTEDNRCTEYGVLRECLDKAFPELDDEMKGPIL